MREKRGKETEVEYFINFGKRKVNRDVLVKTWCTERTNIHPQSK